MSSIKDYWLNESHIVGPHVKKIIESMLNRNDAFSMEFLYEMMILEKSKKKRKSPPKVILTAKHNGVLEVPEGKKVNELPYSHFARLAKEKGFEEISKALTNLEVWNRKRDPELAQWAKSTQRKLHKQFRPDVKEKFLFDF